MLKIIQKRKIFYVFSVTLCIISVLSLVFWGLKPAIDFTGGTLMEVNFNEIQRPQPSEIREKLIAANSDLSDITVQLAGDKGAILRLKTINEEIHQSILKSLRDNFAPTGTIEEVRFESIGAIIGNELRQKAAWAITLAVIGIILYIAWSFRKVSVPVSSWKYGFGAIIALCHDLLITIGAFSVLGHFFGMEVDILFITALLTILGYSVHDTIVVYDRTRENLLKIKGNFEDIVNQSLNQTLVRSLNTSLTVLLTLLAVYFFGGETIKNFTLALIIGITFGTYSSIFIASALLVDWQKFEARKK